MYWTDYETPRRALKPLREELIEAAQEILNSADDLSFVYTGSPYSRVLARVMAEVSSSIRKSVRVILPGDDGAGDLQKCLERDLAQVREHRCAFEPRPFSWSDFENFLDRSTRELRAVDPLIAFSVFFAETGRDTHIFEAHWPRVADQNFDPIQRKSIGPVNWCLEDRESDTEAARHMMVGGVAGWPNFLLTTPEIYPSLFKSVLGKKVDDVSLEVQARALSAMGLASESPEEWNHLSRRLGSYEPLLESLSPKAREVWLTPMDRLMEKWNLGALDVGSRNTEVYGTVF